MPKKKTAKKKDPNATARSTGKTRASKNKEIRQKDLRERIQGSNLITYIAKTEEEIDGVMKHVDSLRYVKKSYNDPETKKKKEYITNQAEVQLELAKSDTKIRALRLKSDSQFKRLAKILPDLKNVSLEDEDGNNPFKDLASAMRDLTKASQMT